MKKITILLASFIAISCAKDDVLTQEEYLKIIKEGIVLVDTDVISTPNPTPDTTPPPTIVYELHKESYLNQRSGIMFNWSDGGGDKLYNTQVEFVGDRNYMWYAQGQAYHDVNSDGYMDILVGMENQTDGYWMEWLINQGDNKNFKTRDWVINDDTSGIQGHKICKTDVNNDGIADFVIFGVDERVQGDYTGNLTTLIGRENNKWDLTDTPNPDRYWFHSGAVGDLNGDGFVDVVGGDFIWWGDGEGHFNNSGINLSSYSTHTVAYEILDMNGDGMNDILLGTQTAGGTDAIILNNNYSFDSNNQVIYLQKTPNDGIMDMEIIDIDSDGDLDIIQSRTNYDEESQLFLFINDDMKFTLDSEYFIESRDGNNINGEWDQYGWSRFKFDDIDGDGEDEILAENFQDGPFNGLKKINGEWKRATFIPGN